MFFCTIILHSVDETVMCFHVLIITLKQTDGLELIIVSSHTNTVTFAFRHALHIHV